MNRGLRGLDSSSATYWEQRYASGGTSGPGSTGQLAQYKARFLNDFVRRHRIRSIIEFGCGDGGQLALADYPRYLGLDVSPTAIIRCTERFRDDHAKSFMLYSGDAFHDPARFLRADLALSIDVIYHLIEDDVFEAHMWHLFAAARRWVVIYSNNEDAPKKQHVRRRRFTDWTDQLRHWQLAEQVPNPHPFTGDLATGSWSNYYVYRFVKRKFWSTR